MTFDERRKFIEDNLDAKEWHEKLAKTVIDDNYSKVNGVSSYLDDVATYLLESRDIKSGRKIDNSYYRNDKDYYNNYSIGKNTIPLDTHIVEEIIGQGTQQNNDSRRLLKNLLTYMTLDEDVIKNFVLHWNMDISDCSEEFTNTWEWIHLELGEYLTDVELELLQHFDGTRSMSEIARECNVSQPYISKQIKKICSKLHKSVIFFVQKLHI